MFDPIADEDGRQKFRRKLAYVDRRSKRMWDNGSLDDAAYGLVQRALIAGAIHSLDDDERATARKNGALGRMQQLLRDDTDEAQTGALARVVASIYDEMFGAGEVDASSYVDTLFAVGQLPDEFFSDVWDYLQEQEFLERNPPGHRTPSSRDREDLGDEPDRRKEELADQIFGARNQHISREARR